VIPKGPLGTLHILQTAGEMWPLNLEGIALHKGDRVRIVNDKIWCGQLGASMMDEAVLQLTAPMGERTSGDGEKESWANVQINRMGLYKVCWCGNVQKCDKDENFFMHVATINVNGVMMTMAGNGSRPIYGRPILSGTKMQETALEDPFGIAVGGKDGMTVFVSERLGSRVRWLDLNEGLQYVLCGSIAGLGGDGGPAKHGKLYRPMGLGLSVDKMTLYIADSANNRVRAVRVDQPMLWDGELTTVVGNGNRGYSGNGGPAEKAELNEPTCVQVDLNDMLWICDRGNNMVRVVSMGIEVRIPGTSEFAKSIILGAAGNGLNGLTGDNGNGGESTMAQVGAPVALAVSAEYVSAELGTLPSTVYIAEELTHQIRAIGLDFENYIGIISTMVGDGAPNFRKGSNLQEAIPEGARSALVDKPQGVATLDGIIYISDTKNNRILMLPRIEYLSLGCWRENIEQPWIPSVEPSTDDDPFLDGMPETRTDAIRKCAYAALKRGHIVFGLRAMGSCATGPLAHLTYRNEGSSSSCANGRGGSRDNSMYRFARPGGMVEQTGLIYRLSGREGTPGFSGDLGTAWVASLDTPTGVAVNPVSRDVLIADSGNERLRIIFNQLGPNRHHSEVCTNGLACYITITGNGLIRQQARRDADGWALWVGVVCRGIRRKQPDQGRTVVLLHEKALLLGHAAGEEGGHVPALLLCERRRCLWANHGLRRAEGVHPGRWHGVHYRARRRKSSPFLLRCAVRPRAARTAPLELGPGARHRRGQNVWPVS
jgi:hypothetical protein